MLFIDVKSKDNHLVVFRKVNYLPGSYDVGKPHDENLRGYFQEQLNTKLESLKLDQCRKWLQ